MEMFTKKIRNEGPIQESQEYIMRFLETNSTYGGEILIRTATRNINQCNKNMN